MKAFDSQPSNVDSSLDDAMPTGSRMMGVRAIGIDVVWRVAERGCINK